jgi:hypothetical protein
MTPMPPRAPEWLLHSLLPARELEYVMGDLVEEYALRSAGSSTLPVRYWYTMQVCRSIVPLIWTSIARAGWLSTLSIAGAAWVSASVVEALATALLQQLLAPDSLLFTVGSAAIGLATIAAGGYVAGSIKPQSSIVMAAIVLVVVVTLMATAAGSAPLWYALVFLVVGPVAAVSGGVIASRGRATHR